MGISYGGVVVQAFLLRHPGLTASAVVCDSFCTTTPETLGQRLMMAGAKMQPLQLRLVPRRWWRAMITPVYRRWPAALEAMARIFEDADLDDLITQRRVVNAVDLEEPLRRTDVPTLCLVGDHSRLAVQMMRRTQRAIPGARLEIIRDSFDPSNLCQPEAFTRLVREWVREVESR